MGKLEKQVTKLIKELDKTEAPGAGGRVLLCVAEQLAESHPELARQLAREAITRIERLMCVDDLLGRAWAIVRMP